MNRTFLPLLLSLALAACGRGRAAAPPAGDAVAVRVAPVSVDWIAPPVTATGTLGPKEEVTLSFKVGGVVSRIFVDEGRAVRAGDTLAELDLSEIDAAVVRARSAAENAERDLTRAGRLYADSVATLEQAQNAQTGRDVAHAELETTLFNRRYAVIVAPASGLILRRSAEPGELVQAGRAILTLGSHARGVVVRAGLADREVVRIGRGDRAVVRFDALPERAFEGAVTEIAGAADPCAEAGEGWGCGQGRSLVPLKTRGIPGCFCPHGGPPGAGRRWRPSRGGRPRRSTSPLSRWSPYFQARTPATWSGSS